MYNIILADPPWKYNSRANHKTRFRGGACGHYDLMEMEDIKSLPIENIAAVNWFRKKINQMIKERK